MSLKFKFAVPVLTAVLGAAAVPCMAQNNNGGGGGNNNGGGNGGGGRGGNFNPQQFMQRRMDSLKQQLGATDEEFSALQPKIEAVMTAQMSSMGGRGGFGGGNRGNRGGGNGGGGNNNGGGNGGNGGGGGGGMDQNASPLAKAMSDLRTTLDDKDAKPEDIKSKLEAVRDAKKTAHDTLVKAQEDLKSVLTQRQEAVLVENNMLD